MTLFYVVTLHLYTSVSGQNFPLYLLLGRRLHSCFLEPWHIPAEDDRRYLKK